MQKFFFSILIGFLTPIAIFSQLHQDSVHLNTHLFDKFYNGIVLKKSGEKQIALLNYNTLDQSIVFQQGGQVLSLINLLTIDTVYINDKKFIPVKDLFYEFSAGTEKSGLCISYTSRNKPVVATSDHNGSSRQEASAVSNTVSNVYVSRSSYNAAYAVEFIKHYWVKSYNDLYKANNKKQFLKALPSYLGTAAKTYLNEHEVDFQSENDLVKLMQYCNEQKVQ